MTDEPTAKLIRVNDETEGLIVEGLLKDAGISCWLHTHGTQEALPLSVGEQAWTDVMVLPKDLDQALAILAAEKGVTVEELTQEALQAGETMSQDAKDHI